MGHFAKSPLAGIVPLLLVVITILETAAGALSAIGCVLLIFRHDPTVAFYGALISAIAILALFFGQRMAKDIRGRRFSPRISCSRWSRFTFCADR